MQVSSLSSSLGLLSAASISDSLTAERRKRRKKRKSLEKDLSKLAEDINSKLSSKSSREKKKKRKKRKRDRELIRKLKGRIKRQAVMAFAPPRETKGARYLDVNVSLGLDIRGLKKGGRPRVRLVPQVVQVVPSVSRVFLFLIKYE